MTVNYYEYIHSAEWFEKAEAAKARAGYRCQVCNRGQDEIVLDAHHRTYERLGHELPEDITVLCRECHELYEANKKVNPVKPQWRRGKSINKPVTAQELIDFVASRRKKL